MTPPVLSMPVARCCSTSFFASHQTRFYCSFSARNGGAPGTVEGLLDWSCQVDKCNALNFGSKSFCFKCHAPKQLQTSLWKCPHCPIFNPMFFEKCCCCKRSVSPQIPPAAGSSSELAPAPWVCQRCGCRNDPAKVAPRDAEGQGVQTPADLSRCRQCSAPALSPQWFCAVCKRENNLDRAVCRKCGRARPNAVDEAVVAFCGVGALRGGVAEAPAGQRNKKKKKPSAPAPRMPQRWLCFSSDCDHVNSAGDTSCVRCGTIFGGLHPWLCPSCCSTSSSSPVEWNPRMAEQCLRCAAERPVSWRCRACGSESPIFAHQCKKCGQMCTADNILSPSASDSEQRENPVNRTRHDDAEAEEEGSVSPQLEIDEDQPQQNDQAENDDDAQRLQVQQQWVCGVCSAFNNAHSAKCHQCMEARPASFSSAPLRSAEKESTDDEAAAAATATKPPRQNNNIAGSMNPGQTIIKQRQSQTVRPGDWSCTACGMHNFASRLVCFSCGVGVNPVASGAHSSSNASLPFQATSSSSSNINKHSGKVMKDGDWRCLNPACGGINFAHRAVCFSCATPRVLPPGDWTCPQCDAWNFKARHECIHCKFPRPSNTTTSSGAAANQRSEGEHQPLPLYFAGFDGAPSMEQPPEGANKKKAPALREVGSSSDTSAGSTWPCWECSCGFAKNSAHRIECVRCGAPKQRTLTAAWTCPKCETNNDPTTTALASSSKTAGPSRRGSPASGFSKSGQRCCSSCGAAAPQQWCCNQCRTMNPEELPQCGQCEAPRPPQKTWACEVCLKGGNDFATDVCRHCDSRRRLLSFEEAELLQRQEEGHGGVFSPPESKHSRNASDFGDDARDRGEDEGGDAQLHAVGDAGMLASRRGHASPPRYGDPSALGVVVSQAIWVCRSGDCGVWNFADRDQCKNCGKDKGGDNPLYRGDWRCQHCRALNRFTSTTCTQCGVGQRALPGDWICGSCNSTNFHFRRICFRCNTPRGNTSTTVRPMASMKIGAETPLVSPGVVGQRSHDGTRMESAGGGDDVVSKGAASTASQNVPQSGEELLSMFAASPESETYISNTRAHRENDNADDESVAVVVEKKVASGGGGVGRQETGEDIDDDDDEDVLLDDDDASAAAAEMSIEQWTCSLCGASNLMDLSSCSRCGMTK